MVENALKQSEYPHKTKPYTLEGRRVGGCKDAKLLVTYFWPRNQINEYVAIYLCISAPAVTVYCTCSVISRRFRLFLGQCRGAPFGAV